MNIFLWIVQVLLALHTLMGAVWKFSNSEQSLESLSVLPHSVWIGLAVLEIICSLALLLPAIKKGVGMLVPISALVIAGEMILFTGLHINAGTEDKTPMYYWLVVTVICAFLAYARYKKRPLL